MEIKTPRHSVSVEGLLGALRRLAGRRVERREWQAGGLLAALALAFVAGHYVGLPSGLGGRLRALVDERPEAVLRALRPVPAATPRLEIDIKHKHHQRLEWKREQALERGLIITDDDSYVPARVTLGGETARVRMRLKGDYPDHLEGDKWSFRIKVRGGDTLLGMRNFSIQDPKRSGWIKEWILHRLLAYEGLIGLRYRFVDVVMNGRPLGVFALEESFGKELLEHNQRLEAPVLKFDEALLIDPTRTNRGDRAQQADVFFAADVLSFESNKTLDDPTLRERFTTARALLDQLRRRERPLSEVVDVARAARLFALQEILGGQHSLRWKNVRFYFDPGARRLELIAYNAYGPDLALPGFRELFHQRWREGDVGPYYVFEWLDLFFSDPEFQAHYWRELERLTAPGTLEAFFTAIEPELEQELATLAADGAEAQAGRADYLANRDAVREFIHPKLPLRVALDAVDRDRGSLRLSVLNRGSVPVALQSLRCGGVAIATGLALRIEGRVSSGPARPQTLEIAVADGADLSACLEERVREQGQEFHAGLELRYTLPGGVRPRSSLVEALDWTPELTRDPALLGNDDSLAELVARGVVAVDEAAGELRIRPGHWRLERDAVFPKGRRVVGGPGTTLDLAAGAAVISFSPLSLRGSEAAPFTISSRDGSGQGLVVVSAPTESELVHVEITGQGSLARPGWSFSGAVTFHESDVRIEASRFAANRSEDLVNLVRSDFAIRTSNFADSRSDALDVDFGDGSIADSRFSACGNDCIDVSRSVATVERVAIEGAGDKGLSVGEKSHVKLSDATFSGAAIGIACKDGSDLEVARVLLEDSETGIAAYRKKPEFGGGVVHAAEVRWRGVTTEVANDAHSLVYLGDERVAGAAWTGAP